jgi:glycosyltransferase involved in cell wall biosynthesis
MPESPLVSIIIPAFNVAGLIAETLESVRSQTFQNFEAIIVDDGSTDQTADVARRFCEMDSRFILLQQSNGGESRARNAAIERARGDWIAFLDADDVWLPQKLERQMTLAAQDPRANFLFCNFYIWDGRRDLQLMYQDDQSLPEGDTLRELIFSDLYGTLTVVARRELLDATGIFDPDLPLGQDWDFWLRLAEHGLCARGLREPLARYRHWSGSQTMNRSRRIDRDVRVLEKNLKRTPLAELRPLYRRSLAAALADREVARARPFVENNPRAIREAIARAWHYQPRLKWLRWYLRLVWPKFLGGKKTAGLVYQKIRNHW